jgi:uncharacterized protein YodC (DUF2158 family)
MSRDIEQQVDTNSAEFKQGVEAGLKDFEIGNVVQLRSGGPKMTVHGLVSDGDVICQWFEGNAVHEESFPREALQKVELVKAGGSRREDGVFVVN